MSRFYENAKQIGTTDDGIDIYATSVKLSNIVAVEFKQESVGPDGGPLWYRLRDGSRVPAVYVEEADFMSEDEPVVYWVSRARAVETVKLARMTLTEV